MNELGGAHIVIGHYIVEFGPFGRVEIRDFLSKETLFDGDIERLIKKVSV